MGSINVDYDTDTKLYSVTGSSKAGEFVISGPWTTRELAEAHAQKIIGIFNEAATEIIADSKRRIILA